MIAAGCRERGRETCSRATRWRQGCRSVRTCVDSMGFSEAKERGAGREEMACRTRGGVPAVVGWRQLREAEAGAVGRYTGPRVGGRTGPGGQGRQEGDGGLGWVVAAPVRLLCFSFLFLVLLGWFGSFAPSRGLRRCECDAPWRLFQRALFSDPAALRRWRPRQVGFRRAR